MKLYEIAFGIYPRRVGIYLVEKGLTNIERIQFDLAEGWPSPVMAAVNPGGTVPTLETDDGTIIGSSIAILEYLEERFPTPTMLGETPEARAKARELVSIIDEATSLFSVWVRKVSPFFAPTEKQSLEAGRLAAAACYARFRVLEKHIGMINGEFLAGDKVTIADCIAYSHLQFARDLYSVPLPEDCPKLEDWFNRFAKRPSAAPEEFFAPLMPITRGLPEQTMASELPAQPAAATSA